ncbi:poly(glycerol-phosphate) alpha-glucosyltransferase [Staphylococcus petrasii]|uniref:poly(glycerol-phosphate) alpha-glucosyltransferase n=1 Tax=Staphylococcus petrasii TaxID=1276936 RepID=UPI000CD11ACB|nr:poly(glycerol-phosphate) alpha-glucosyltransferase [Staphylococcus petrasii]PNZ80058.1 poly(glycerol-phosphate) alpha-glucosyltransferase [Staphylococcus petrasii]TGA82014.1 poly(glycerol-phosphate) alpha-glucosyltransferase [Staphylococcus petrasii]SUM60839.1 poly (glycerol-phosphate) alpha-glucosyltransferase [Staphylococcus petrasii]
MNFEDNIKKLIDEVNNKEDIENYVFLSLGKPNVKATVKLLKKARYLERDILKQAQNFRKKSGEYPTWVKLDIVTHFEKVPFKQLKDEMVNTRRNHIEYGIALDDYWNTTFLPEEINVNAFVIPKKESHGKYLSEQNINSYLKKYTSHNKGFSHEFYENKDVIKFYTKSYFLEENHIYELKSSGFEKGLREIDDFSKEIDDLILSSVEYLKNMVMENGRYKYGYFPHFDKEIDTYNILRHSSSTYALIEGLAYLNRPLDSATKAIDYIIDNYVYEKDEKAYVYDDTENINEIKLGQNASFIFAICEYLKVNHNETYLEVAQKVAKGIVSMIDSETYDTVHILNYPDLTVKEKFRIIYYDGEAALALLRLFQIDGNHEWLKIVKKLMNRFIEKEYWQHHDHWLGYCSNELVQISPEEKYFEFGIKNVNTYLEYIKTREKTFPTFLEMLMASYQLIKKAKEAGHEELVNKLIDEEELLNVIDIRAKYQRTGFFYPEIAMYFKNPARILGSFYMKNHGYRVRIDDIEHYISGYVQYQKEFKK